MINLLISVGVFLTYTVVIALRFRVQPSISASWYKLKGASWMFFTFWTWGAAIPIVMLDLGEWYTLGAVSLMAVGIAGAFRNNKLTSILHNSFTYLAIALLLVGLILNNIWWPAVAGLVFYTLTTKLEVSNKTWWDEYAIYFFIMGGIYQLVA